MTNYSIVQYTGRAHEFFVEINTNGAITRSGPYDTEEKAKRRIRDLKRADAKAAIALDGQIVEALKTGEPVRVDIVDGKRRIVTPAEREFINTGYMPLHNPAITERAREILTDRDLDEAAADLAADQIGLPKLSTATNGGYGKFNTEPTAYDRMAAFRRNSDPGWINPPFNPYRGKPRNGYRPAHRANRFRK